MVSPLNQNTLYGPVNPDGLPKIVAFCSAAARSGKSTCANILVNEYGYTRLRFAGVLKDMVRVFLKCLVPDDHVDSYIEGLNKDRIMPAIGYSARDLMITLGTDWGRRCVDKDIWATLLAHGVARVVSNGGRVVIDDLRFPNELAMLKQAGAKVFFIHRPSVTPEVPLNCAEGLISHKDCNFAYENSSSLEALEWWVRSSMDVFAS